jgi:mono/diheme cytochrome c family protein
MKKALKILGVIVGVIVLLIAAFAAWVQLTPLPKFEPQSLDITVSRDSLSVARGRKIIETGCVGCHLGEDGKLSGRLFSRATDPFGEYWSRNITRHPEKGIGSYKDGELAYLLRTGIRPNGEWAGPYMSSPMMSDEDIACMIAFLRSDSPLLEASEASHPEPKYSFLAKMLIKLGALKPYPYDGKPQTAPPATDQIAYGRYLATAVYDCFNCHSASFETNNRFEPEKSPNYFGGGNPMHDIDFNPVVSANITMHKTDGIGAWTKEQFAEAIRTGARPDQRVLSIAMPRYGLLDDQEIDAIWAYLQTVPVLDKEVAKEN